MSELDIHNGALALIGHDRVIPAIDSTMTENVRCLLEWDGARIRVLSAHEWNWLVQETPFIEGAMCDCDEYNPNAEYMYDRPTDIIRLCSVLDINLRRANYRQADGKIYSLCPEVKFRTLPDEEDPDVWPVLVRDAITAELAARIAFAMTGNAKTVAAMKALASSSLAQAIELDSKEMARGGTAGDKYAKSRR